MDRRPEMGVGLMWPSTQPSRPWSRHCRSFDYDYGKPCTRYAIPGESVCENHCITSKPLVVCLCGSTRYWETFRDVGLDLTMAGIMVLSIGIAAPDSMTLAHPNTMQGEAQKVMLDKLHKDKIAISNQVLVLNVDGYIDDSTRSEVHYANAIGRPVKWLYPDKVPSL